MHTSFKSLPHIVDLQLRDLLHDVHPRVLVLEVEAGIAIRRALLHALGVCEIGYID